MELESSQAYANFRAWCPRKEVGVGVSHPITWRYYDWGPRTYLEPIICIHSLIGSAECFYQQMIFLPPRGYRVISIQIPVYWTIGEFCDAFHLFLETIPHRRFHLYGAGLGGFLAMHYAVRKPDNVASLILTHSFLATENLNLCVPYSPTVLRWLPDFLVRSTMRAILPKGRVSLDMANAAEFAIGHTIHCSREVLASRLALSTTSSTVVNRVHISQNAITLIDTLDRQQPALQLSELTASQLSEARRALLKNGGDFPYIVAFDDVNVHLLVHLRRNAANPVRDIALPAPARPRVVPAVVRRRRALEQTVSQAKEAGNEEIQAVAKKPKRAKKSDDEILKEAKAIVAADENSRMERYAFEVGRLSEYLPDRGDAYLAAVLEECGGVLEVAIANSRAEMYNDRFYEESHSRAISEKILELRKAEEEGEDEEAFKGGDIAAANGEYRQLEEGVDARVPKQNESDVDGGTGAAYRRIGVLNVDPLGSADVASKDAGTSIDAERNYGFIDDDRSMVNDDAIMALSPPAKTPEHGSSSVAMHDDDPLVGRKRKDDPRSTVSSVDLGVNELFLNVDGGPGRMNEDDSDTDRSPTFGRLESSADSRRQRRSRGQSYTEESDGIGAYVTSEKVGMRSRGPLVGRGPAPFSNVATETGLSPGEAWRRAVRARDEEESSANDDKVTQISLSSGASLLEANENPLELPGHGPQYKPDRSQYKSDTSRPELQTNSSESRLAKESPNTKSPRALTPRQGSSYTRDGGLMSSGAETHVGSSVDAETSGRGQKEQDEWGGYSQHERGLASAIPSSPRVGTKGKSDAAFEKKMDSSVLVENEEETDGEVEESARLREWRMSAQAASKNVKR